MHHSPGGVQFVRLVGTVVFGQRPDAEDRRQHRDLRHELEQQHTHRLAAAPDGQRDGEDKHQESPA